MSDPTQSLPPQYWGPGDHPFWDEFAPLTLDHLVERWPSLPITSSLALYRARSLLAGISKRIPLRFRSLPGGGWVLAARGFLGLPGAFTLLEPQGEMTPEVEREILEAVSTAPEPVYMSEISEAFLERSPELVSHFDLSDTRELFEYVYQLEEQAALPGNRHRARRKDAVRVESDLSPRVIPIGRENVDLCDQLARSWLSSWLSSKGESSSSNETITDGLAEDQNAYKFAMEHFEELGLFGWLLLVDDKPMCLAICEHLTNEVAGFRFVKALREPRGLQPYLEREVAKILMGRGYVYWNWDADAGDPGLRERKTVARPCRLERACRLTPKL